MISAGLQFEQGEAKIQWANAPTGLVMNSSNDSLSSDLISKNVGKRCENGSWTTAKLAQLYREECIKFKQARTESEIIAPLGFTYESLWRRSNELPQPVVGHIIESLESYDYVFQIQFMVIGIDQEGGTFIPHIWVIDQEPRQRDDLSLDSEVRPSNQRPCEDPPIPALRNMAGRRGLHQDEGRGEGEGLDGAQDDGHDGLSLERH